MSANFVYVYGCPEDKVRIAKKLVDHAYEYDYAVVLEPAIADLPPFLVLGIQFTPYVKGRFIGILFTRKNLSDFPFHDVIDGRGVYEIMTCSDKESIDYFEEFISRESAFRPVAVVR